MLDAVRSVLNQTLSRSEYEIIVIKNFNEELIDRFLLENGVKSIEAQSDTTGKWFEIALENSTGSIIAFLDDDDVFAPDKLTRVKLAFYDCPTLDYFHNNSDRFTGSVEGIPCHGEMRKPFTKIDTESKNGFLHALKAGHFQNISSITIRKDVLYRGISIVRETNQFTDIVIFFVSLKLGGLMVHSDEILSLQPIFVLRNVK